MVVAEQSTNQHLSSGSTKTPLRVLFVSHTYVVGVNQGKLEAIAQRDNVQVGLLAPSNWKALEWNRPLNLEPPSSAIQLYSYPVSLTGRGGAHFYAPWHLYSVFADFKPDIVQVEEEVFSLCAFQCAVWARLSRKSLAVFGWENNDRTFTFPRQQLRQFVLDTAKLVVAGNSDGAALLSKWGFKGLVEVMPQLGVDPQIFHPCSQQKEPHKFRIGFLGRLAHEKGIDRLLQAATILKKENLNFELIICGSGPYESELKAIASKLHIDHQVTWRNAVSHDRVPEEMAQFDVLVLPSRSVSTWREQFGHVLIEAMAMGIPVIGSTCGEIPNVIGHPELVFPEEDSHELAKILQRMILDSGWRSQMRSFCEERVHQHYTHERIANRLIDLWHFLLNQ